MALRSRTFFVSMKRLGERKALGALMVRLMMALHDFDTSHHGNQEFGAARRARRDRRYDPSELVENDVILHGIFDLKVSDTYDDERKLDEAAGKIQSRLMEMRNIFGDFAYNFIRKHARTS